MVLGSIGFSNRGWIGIGVIDELDLTLLPHFVLSDLPLHDGELITDYLHRISTVLILGFSL